MRLAIATGTNAWRYRDPRLHDAIAAHFDAVFGASSAPLPPETVARQFAHQVLIEPAIGGDELQDPAQSPPPDAACLPSDYDPYQCDEVKGWSDGLCNTVAKRLVDPDVLSQVLGVDAKSIHSLHASSRTGAFRALDTHGNGAAAPLMSEIFGELSSRDFYYLPDTRFFDGAFVPVGPSGKKATLEATREVVLTSPELGAAFLQNARYVKTFITDAALDAWVRSPLIGSGLLAKHPDLLVSATHDTAGRSGVTRAGWLTLQYTPAAGGEQRVIRMPQYAKAGHMVVFRQPGELLQDVMDWYAH